MCANRVLLCRVQESKRAVLYFFCHVVRGNMPPGRASGRRGLGSRPPEVRLRVVGDLG